MVLINRVYRHYKGKRCLVLYVALHSETQEQLVIYRELDNNKLWARPLSMFKEQVTHDGTTEPRFMLESD